MLHLLMCMQVQNDDVTQFAVKENARERDT